ncbi:hypothetical protein COO60DRAFT_1532190 [Scenedesmus sp. NREL 46B-D3]|nr:hypothetical protein COO60DRAFT_1532190 [Scenedesmus sp. NREL 46B-D3]
MLSIRSSRGSSSSMFFLVAARCATRPLLQEAVLFSMSVSCVCKHSPFESGVQQLHRSDCFWHSHMWATDVCCLCQVTVTVQQRIACCSPVG